MKKRVYQHLAETTDYPHRKIASPRVRVISCGLVALTLGIGIGWLARALVTPGPQPAHDQARDAGSPPLAPQELERRLKNERQDAEWKTEREILTMLDAGCQRALIIEDGVALTVLNNRAAVGGGRHGYVALEKRSYPVLGYFLDKEKTIGMGIAGDLRMFCFPFLWKTKSNPPPESLVTLKFPSGRTVVTNEE